MIPEFTYKATGLVFKAICLYFILAVVSSPAVCSEEALLQLKHLITVNDAVLLASPDGDLLYSANADKPLVPASTLKVLTSLAAMHYLNEDYRYPTDFYLDTNSNLIIKGYGDPMLVSEEIQKIASALRPLIDSINDIILDDTYFKKPITIPGTINNSLQPYDAPNGALCVNFNTVNFCFDNQGIVSAEPQTPIVDIARKKIKSAHIKSGRILLSNDSDEITQYAGEIFQYFLREEGIEIRGGIRLGAAKPEADNLIYRHHSQYNLEEIIARLLEYSNNFIANQILLTTGARVFGSPATMEKGVKAATTYVAGQIADPAVTDIVNNLSMVEGSGISRSNRVTARIFLRFLAAFQPHHTLMQHRENEYYKTGTLTGVSTRAGYIESATGGLFPFVVFINTPGKSTSPVMTELKKLIQ